MSQSVIRDYLRAAVGDTAAGLSDTELLDRFAAGRDEAAFELLVWRHAALVQRVCRGALGDHHLAEDAAQATFLILARKAHTFTGRQSVVGWLYRVARRAAMRLARTRARHPAGSAELDLFPAVPASAAPSEDETAVIWIEVSRLPERYRIPVLLCFFEGLTHAEAARRTGWTIGTVAGRMARAKDLLARRLSRRGLGAATAALGLPAGAFVGDTARAATAFANRAVVSGIHPSVTQLAEGVLTTMTAFKLKLAATAAVLCLVSTTIWGLTPAAPRPEASATDEPLVTQTAARTPAQPQPAPPVAAAPPDATPKDGQTPPERLPRPAELAVATNKLKQIMLAMHNYIDVNKCLPHDITDKNGKPLLSWRVAILPYLEQVHVYQQFKLDEPWDSDHNKKLSAKMPEIYRLDFQPKGDARTYCQVFAGPGTPFEPGKKIEITDITDGTSQTLGAVWAGPPVAWARPADLPYDPKKPLPRLELPFKNVFVAGMMDGSVASFRPDLKPDILRLLIERADGQVLPDPSTLTVKAPASPLDLGRGWAEKIQGAQARFREQVRMQEEMLLEMARRIEQLEAENAELRKQLEEAKKK